MPARAFRNQEHCDLRGHRLPVIYFFLPAYLANMAPVVVVGRFEWLAGPIDGGRTWRGVRIFGDHKTWRGLVAGVVVGMIVFAAQRATYQLGYLHTLALIDYAAFDPLLPGFLLGLGTGLATPSSPSSSAGRHRAGCELARFDQLDFMAGAYLFIALIVVPPLGAVLAILPAIFPRQRRDHRDRLRLWPQTRVDLIAAASAAPTRSSTASGSAPKRHGRPTAPSPRVTISTASPWA